MKLHTNEMFVRRQARIGKYATIAGFACLVGGLVLSFQRTDLILLAYAALLPGFLLVNLGKNASVRWGVSPRVDEALASALKSLDARHSLYNYVEGVPVEHLLLGPTGLIVFEVEPFVGDFINTGSKWRRRRSALGFLMALGEGGLGNPTQDAQKSVAAVRRFLVEQIGEETAEDMPIGAMVVFTHPRAKLEVVDPEVPALHVRGLKTEVRQQLGQMKLPPHLQEALAEVFRVD